MQLPLYERVALRIDLPEQDLKKGDIVTTVEFLKARRNLPNAYVVEVFNAIGETIAVLTVKEDDLEALTEQDILRVRHKLPPADMIEIDIPDENPVPVATLPNRVTIELSDTLLKQKGTTIDEAKLQLALILFQQDFFSLGKASEFAGLHPSQFQKELAKRQIQVHYSVEEYWQDIETLDSHEDSSHSYHTS